VHVPFAHSPSRVQARPIANFVWHIEPSQYSVPRHIASPVGSAEPQAPPPVLELLVLADVDALVEDEDELELEEEELLELLDVEEDDDDEDDDEDEVVEAVEVVDPVEVVEPVLDVLPVIVDDDVMPPVPVAVIPPVPVPVADPVCCGILSWSTEAISSQPVTKTTAPKATVQGT